MNGRILRVKHGYNPNSSSMGSIIFALPVSLIAVAFGLAAVSGLILPHFIRDGGRKGPQDENARRAGQPEGNE